jgi:DNA polymerase-3 subunit delta
VSTAPFVYTPARLKELLSPVRPVYILFGEEETLKDEIVEALRSAVLDPSFADFDCETLDAAVTSVEEILASAGAAPFGSEYRLVIVKGAEVYRRREKSADAERLAGGIAQIGNATALVLRAAAPEDDRGRSKTALHAKVDAAVGERGFLVHCRSLSPEALGDWVEGEARKAGKGVESEAVERLVQSANGSRIALRNELEKAICYSGDAPYITLDMVEATCSYNPEDVMFKLVDAVSQRNADRALRLFHEVLRYDTKPQSVAGRLLALLARQIRMITQAHELGRRRIDPNGLKSLPPEIAAELPADGNILSMSWKARELFGAARQWSREELVRAYSLLVECDLANKGGEEGSEDVITNLELLMLALCRREAQK